MKYPVSILLCVLLQALHAAPEIVCAPAAYGEVKGSTGRGEVKQKLFRGNLEGKENAVIIDYDFSRCPNRRNSFFRCNMNVLLAGMPRSFEAEFYSSTEGSVPASLFLVDRTGEVYLLRGRTTQKGWNTITIPMHRFAAWKSGDGNNAPDLPLTLAAVLVDMPEKGAAGRFGIGRITVKADMEPVEVTGYPALPEVFAEKKRTGAAAAQSCQPRQIPA